MGLSVKHGELYLPKASVGQRQAVDLLCGGGAYHGLLRRAQ